MEKNLSMMSYEVREGQKLLNALENAGSPTYPNMPFLCVVPNTISNPLLNLVLC